VSALGEANRLPITIGILMATVMSALDTTVVNVALPHMQGTLSASPEQITWAITSYIVAAAVATPVSGWLVARYGLKFMLLACVAGFTVASVLCGMATTLPELVLFRMLQGALAAPLMPAAQAVLLNINPPERLGRAMAVFTMASVVAPAVGPVVGGYLTEDYSWRSCFYINIPAGIGAIVLISIFLPSEPVRPRRFDFFGFGTLALAIGAFQLALDRGTTQDWFSSTEICIEAAVAGTAFFVYIAHTLTTAQPLFPPGVLRDRNFVTSVVFGFFFSVMMFASLTLLPLMMQGLLGYSVIHSGVLSMPRGLIMLAILPIMGRVDALVDRRLLVAIGVCFIVAAFWEMSRFDLSMDGSRIVWATALQGIGQGILFVPLATLGFATIPQLLRPDASALNNLVRNLGGSVGVAFMQALTAINAQTMHASLAAHITPDDAVRAAAMPEYLSPDTVHGAVALNAEITRQAMMVAYVDDFRLMAIIGIISLPLVFFMRQRGKRRDEGVLDLGHA
jgi:DHA2 family multidrug resistance protein